MSGRGKRKKEQLLSSRLSGRNRKPRRGCSKSAANVPNAISTSNGLEDDKYWVSSVLRCIIRNNNQMELEKLKKKVENENKRKYPDFETEIRRYSTLFSLEESYQANEDEEEGGVLGNTIVSGRSDVRLCEKHCSRAGSCESPECKDLHMCRFYILSKCNFERCHFSHKIGRIHNVRVLQMHSLDALSSRDVCCLLRDVRNRNETTIPKICNFYNVKKGCSREDCQFLHLCKRFVEEDCKFGHDCKRSHNWFDEQPVQVFMRYGICENDVRKVTVLIKKALGINTTTQAATGMNYSQIMKEQIYTQSCPQNESVFGSDAGLGSDIYNCEDSRHVIKEDGYQNEPRSCYGETPERKSEENETHQIHLNEDNDFEDTSSNEDVDIEDNDIEDISSNKDDDLYENKISKKQLTARKGTKNEIYQDDTKSNGYRCTFQESASKSVYRKTKLNTFEHVQAIDSEYTQVAMDNSHETSKKSNATSHVVNNDTLNSGRSNKKDSVERYALNPSREMQDIFADDSTSKQTTVSEDRCDVVKEICLSTLTTGDKECNCPLLTNEFKVRRIALKKETLQWMFYSVDSWTSLHMTPEIQDKLEKSFQLFQQARQCLIEASDAMLHVD